VQNQSPTSEDDSNTPSDPNTSESTKELEKEVLQYMEDNLASNQNPSDWQLVGARGKIIQRPQTVDHPTPTKKRTISSSILEESVWNLL